MSPFKNQAPKGFALIVTLSLMILLTVIAVGLLSLSSISLRTSSQGEAMQAARANAKVALMLAIGDLQKQLGPDTRVTATADQTAGTDPSVSTAPQTQRQWTGAFKSWPTALPAAARPTPEFVQWFVSGTPEMLTEKSFAETALSGESVEIVTTKSVGETADTVRVPLISQTVSNGTKNHFAWWVSDLGTKGLIAPSQELPKAVAETRAEQQSVPASNLQIVNSGASKPFASLSLTDPRLANLPSVQTASLMADDPKIARGLFHDLTTQSRGLLTNVRTGGFRKDLSMEMERATSNDPNKSLYKVGDEPGINFQELWTYYNLHKKLKTTGSATFTTGGKMSSGTPYLEVAASADDCENDDEFYFKQPVIISYQLVLSLLTIVDKLYLVADPIVTFWNPLDVPVVVPKSAFFSVKYWQVPYSLTISVNGGPVNQCPLVASLSPSNDANFLSLLIGSQQQLVFKPGEVIKTSQIGNTKVNTSAQHDLIAEAGFNYGGGVALLVRNTSGANITGLKSTDTITYRATPNRLTAGATTSDGESLAGPGIAAHTRHFSLMHNEYYIGNDRGDNSLGIGNMSIDWDFGNRRLKPSANRGTSAPGISGTKPSGERLYASNFPNIFKPITASDARDLPVSILTAAKQPFMIVSFNAKTENSTESGTKTLARFNPKALHVDFYDLSPKERDMLPYEFSAEPLTSWKNRSLEVSSNGNSYYGGGMNAADGSSVVITHSVPREPLISLAALQHSFANGFDIQRPKYGYGSINAREPMLPQIAHAIGNSTASPMLASGQTEGKLPGNRPLADHSYLANQALWDEWFFSGITPQTESTFNKPRSQKSVATDFFDGTTPLPVARYVPELRGQEPSKITSTYFTGTTPTEDATLNIASLIRVDGLFNINSTSVEGWKTILGARKGRPFVVRNSTGKESVKTNDNNTPVAGLLGPQDLLAPGGDNIAASAPEQWAGRRSLTDDEIDTLARNIVKEVRKRGPFLCLSDFINRRVGNDKELAHAGAIQSALDANDDKINAAYRAGGRAVTGGSHFPFPEAEQGPMSTGAPGIVKQADILTPIAPILSARSDSFQIRAYGEKTDSSGKVIARAWCEATVQRSPEFLDSTDAPEKAYSSISQTNQTFGRRFDIISFRWLNSSEA